MTRVDPQIIVDDWKNAIQGELIDPPAYVRSAEEELEFQRQIDNANFLHHSMEEIDRVIAASAQMELALPKMNARAYARERFAAYWKRVVYPLTCNRKEQEIPERLQVCRQSARISMLPSGKQMLTWDNKAGLPLFCPDDAREEAMRLSRRVTPHLLELLQRPGYSAHYLCATAPNVAPGELEKGMRAMYRRWNSIMRACKKKRSRPFPFVGAVVVMEAPLGRMRDWHPHLNIIVVCDGFLDYKALRERWHWNIEMRKLEGTKPAIERAFREIIKYACRTVAEKSYAKSSSVDSDHGPGRFHRDPQPGGESGLDRRERAAADQISAGEISRFGSGGVSPGLGCDEREAPNSQTGQAPAMEDWSALEALEYYRAHSRFRRTRTYRKLYGLPKPKPVDRTGQQYTGFLEKRAGGYVQRSALLESIPGDKSTPERTRNSYLDAWIKLLGPKDLLARARRAAASLQINVGPVSLAV